MGEADVKLLFGAAEGSLGQITTDLTNMLKSLDSNPLRIKIGVDIDNASIEKFRAQIADINKLMGGMGTVQTTGVDTASTASAAANMADLAARTREVASAANAKAVAVKSDAAEESKRQSLLKRSYTLLTQMQNAESKWTAAKNGKSASSYTAIQDDIAALQKWNLEFKSGSMTAEKFAAKLSTVSTNFVTNSNAIKGVNENTQTLGQRLGSLSAKFGTWFSLTRVIMAAYRAVKQMVSNVIELDTAMTELKKVTNETDATYEKFLVGAHSRAKELGAALSDTVSATADFARLGFGIEDAEKLADAAIVYKNVGDGIGDIETASESVIATMQAFNVPAEQVMSIVDKFNEVGNNFAISSGGVGDALLRSAAALHSANNTLDESIALAAAANTIVQDPEKVGTTLKTVSMYLRAAKSDAEGAGEATDGMANSVSELRNEILALTGYKVDIQTDKNTFKSTYQILKELSEVWDELTDVSQANILELVGGKKNANVVSALLEDFDIAERAITTSANSAGSALKENEKVLESIRGKMNVMKATFEALSQNLIGSDIVKVIIDFSTGLMELINSVLKVIDVCGGLKTVILAVSSALLIFKGELIASKVALLGVAAAEKIVTFFTGLWHGIIKIKNVIPDAIIAWEMYAANVMTAGEAIQASIPVLGLVLVVITALVAVMSGYNQKLGEAVEESKKQAKESANVVDSLLELKSQLNDGTKSTDELTSAFKEQLKAMGKTETEIDTLISKYGGLSGALKATTEEALKKAKIDADTAVATASAQLNRSGLKWEGLEPITLNVSPLISTGDEALNTQIKQMLDEVAWVPQSNMSAEYAPKDTSPEGLYEYYTVLTEIVSLIQETASATGNSDMLNMGIPFFKTTYGDITDAITVLEEGANNYKEAIQNSFRADANLALFEYLKNNVIESKEDLDTFIDSVRNNTEYTEEYKQVLIDVANNAFPQLSASTQNAGKDIDETRRLLNSLSAALQTAKSAFELFNEVEKDFNSTGVISAENIQKILGKFPDLEDELYEYIMGMRTGASVMDLLKTKSDNMATMSASAFKRMYLSSSVVSEDIANDFAEACKYVGIQWDRTRSIMETINANIIDANGNVTRTFADQWTIACQNVGSNMQGLAMGIQTLLMGGYENTYVGEDGHAYYSAPDGGQYTFANDAASLYNTDKEAFKKQYPQLAYLADQGASGDEIYGAVNKLYVDWIKKNYTQSSKWEQTQKDYEERLKQFVITSDDKSGSDKNEALDNYLKDAENRYKVHQDETKYIEELQWAHDNLTKDKKERLDIVGKINEAYRDLADNRIKDSKHQIDLNKELYGEDYNATAEWTEIQRIAHEEAERLRTMGYDNNSNEIQELQKEWWDAENSKLDFYNKQHENIIRDIEHARDMALNADENADVTSYYRRLQEEYHKEAERLRLLDPEKYKEEIQEFQQLWWDAEKEILDHKKQVVEDFLDELQKEIDDSYDIRISRLNSQSSLLSSHFNIINAIAEEQHNINKELIEAKTIGAEMNEMERESLFSKEDHIRLSSKLSDIMLDVTDLQHNYMQDLETATKDTIDEITNQYERQYELKMKEYEIVKAELSLAKAQQALENTKNEKSVRTWDGSSWTYAANIQDVIDAQEEVENAKYALTQSKTEEAQQKVLNAIESDADALETEKNKLTTAIDEMAEKLNDAGSNITSALRNIAQTDLPMFDFIINSVGDALGELFGISDAQTEGIRKSVKGVDISEISGGNSILEFMKSNSEAWHTADSEERKNLEKANKDMAKYLGLTYDSAAGRWRKSDGTFAYASGTKSAKRGLGLFDEDGFGSELILSDDGILTKFNGGEKVFSSEMAERLWQMAQGNYTFGITANSPDFGKVIPIEDRINNAINNISNAFGDTYMIKDVQLNETEGGTLKGFINFLKKKV